MSRKGNWIVIGLLAAAAGGYALYRMNFSDQDIATPLTAAVGVQKRGPTVLLHLVLTDANGKPVTGVRLPNGRTPPEPKVQILDTNRNSVYSCTLSYG